jgi:hypothetical protein
MDSTILVEEQIEEGGRLIEQLVRDGFDVTGAFWVRSPNTYDRPWFFVASKTVDQAGLHVAYGAVHTAIHRIPAPWGPALWHSEVSELKLISPNDPLAQTLLTLRDSHPGRKRFRDITARNWPLDEVYIYPSLGKADDES